MVVPMYTWIVISKGLSTPCSKTPTPCYQDKKNISGILFYDEYIKIYTIKRTSAIARMRIK